MTTPIFPMLTVIHPVYKIISTLTRPALEFELFTREYLRTLKEGQ